MAQKNAAGIDVSFWQDDNSTPQMVDFTTARRAGIAFAYMKASQANWADSDFLLNWQHAKAAGMPRGAYHFLTWDVPVREQARFFCGLLRQDPGNLPPVLDFECRTGVPGKAQAAAAARVFLEEVEAELGIRPIVYTSPSYWKEFGSSDVWFARFALWIAHYYVSAPSLPAPWTDWTFWQWGSGKGVGPSLGAESKDIDQDWFNGNEAAFRARFALDSVAPLPDPIEPTGLRYQATGALNVRSGPGVAYPVLGMLPKGSQVIVEDMAGQHAWGLFHDAQGREGWICIEMASRRYAVRAEAEHV